jgi:benzoate membrane transport protein
MSLSLPALAAGLLAGFVGFASGFPVFLQGLRAMGASPDQAASGLTAIMVAMGLCGIALSLLQRMPISVGQSTPGAALLASSPMPAGGFDEAVGAFLVAGALARWPCWRGSGGHSGAPSLRSRRRSPVKAVAAAPVAGLAILLAWAVAARLNRLLAVPAAVLTAALFIVLTVPLPAGLSAAAVAEPLAVVPRFSTAALLGRALPLFLVTMASQSIPGVAVLQANGYRPAPGPLFAATGLSTMAAAPFGGHAVNIAPMITALCAGEEAGPDPARRWHAAVWAGLVYLVFGLLAGAATRFAKAAPPVLIQGVAGLALLGAFASAMQAALSDPNGARRRW